MSAYKIEIRNGSKNSFRYKEILKKSGFSWDGSCWYKDISQEKEALHWENWARFRGLRMKAIGEASERGGHYRKDFFSKYPPEYHGKYRCAYCGRRISKDQVQVDHIISVDLAKKRDDIRRKIVSYGWESINDPENLCAACRTCNRLKSNKGGLWVLRGRFGKRKQGQRILLYIRGGLSIAIGIGIGLLDPFMGQVAGGLMFIFFVILY